MCLDGSPPDSEAARLTGGNFLQWEQTLKSTATALGMGQAPSVHLQIFLTAVVRPVGATLCL